MLKKLLFYSISHRIRSKTIKQMINLRLIIYAWIKKNMKLARNKYFFGGKKFKYNSAKCLK